jgi:hypothetical protein
MIAGHYRPGKLAVYNLKIDSSFLNKKGGAQ